MNQDSTPQIGEYSYFDSQSADASVFWMVTTENGECACHYSLPELKKNLPFVHCNGCIKSVNKEVQPLKYEVTIHTEPFR